MSRYPIVGIAGKARTGKDTLATLMLDLGIARYRCAFADPIRKMLIAGLRIDPESFAEEHRKERAIAHLGVTPRRLMQTLGTEWGRQMVHPDMWIVEAQLVYMERGPGMVVTDVRMENEAAWIRNVGGRIVHLQRQATPLPVAHSSEDGVAFREGDIVFDNSATRDELTTRLRDLFLQATP